MDINEELKKFVEKKGLDFTLGELARYFWGIGKTETVDKACQCLELDPLGNIPIGLVANHDQHEVLDVVFPVGIGDVAALDSLSDERVGDLQQFDCLGFRDGVSHFEILPAGRRIERRETRSSGVRFCVSPFDRNCCN